mmetsp:Transcript_9396/g.33172  ORF Transcript_9396/g.33172 Transcript_9396/m.33172 type:complete len:294 (-) Transcript_9396:2-883(-)
MFPEASVSSRPSTICSACSSMVTSTFPSLLGSKRAMLSSRMRDTRAPLGLVPRGGPSVSRNDAITWLTSSSVRASTSTSMSTSCRSQYRLAASTAKRTPPAAATWLSLIIIMSSSPNRWLRPPPMRTAHLSKRRSPGAVFLVSNTTAGAATRAMAFASVATPLIRCIRFNAVRSASSSARASPCTWPRTVPARTCSPSATSHVVQVRSSAHWNTADAAASPATTPSALAKNVARASRPSGTVASEVKSPPRASSSKRGLTDANTSKEAAIAIVEGAKQATRFRDAHETSLRRG